MIEPNQQPIDAIYERGTLRILHPEDVDLSEGQQVRVILKPRLTPEEMTELAGSVYEGLSDDDVAEIERIALDRGNFSGQQPA